MNCYVFLVVTSLLTVLEWDRLVSAQRPMGRMMAAPLRNLGFNRDPPVMCNHDILIIYQDCRMCVCPRPNRVAKCFKKSCDLRTKTTGQCPQSFLRMEDGYCTPRLSKGCKIDADCPGDQLCCMDFCGSPRCVNPMPLDASTGLVTHAGMGYKSF